IRPAGRLRPQNEYLAILLGCRETAIGQSACRHRPSAGGSNRCGSDIRLVPLNVGAAAKRSLGK
ncbi:hypothetical protein, partial [Aquabacterium sp.]|uniref:hypothetical protein n=1 Tax=Aquabacterium sp. TaxID=1872578 RepID=UPI0025BF560B